MTPATTLEAVLAKLGDLPANITPVLADGYADFDDYEFCVLDGYTGDWFPSLEDVIEAYGDEDITLRIYPPKPAHIFTR
jgi:hypothetical protein